MDLSHRKASGKVRFLHTDMTPLANYPVRVDQTSHSFLFGCGVFDSVQLFRETDPEKQAVIRARLDKWLKLFNYGTLPFYWGRYEPEEGKTAKEETLQAAQYLRKRHVTLKGHPLCWHTACAPWLLKYSNEEIMRRQLDRITREVTDFNGLIDLWDVINEVVIMPEFDRYDNAVTRLCVEKGRVGLVREVFEQARELLAESAKSVTEEDLARFVVLAEGIKGFDFTGELRQIACPVLIIGSADDRVLGADSSEEIAEQLKDRPDCELYLYDGYGHAAYDLAPDYKERLLRFLIAADDE